MTLLTVCQDVCAVVGVMRPASIFSGLATSRTQQELLALANEIAQRIAYDNRDWTKLKTTTSIIGDVSNDGQSFLPLPVNFKRIILNANVRRQNRSIYPMLFIPNDDKFIQRRLMNIVAPYGGEWIINGGNLYISPPMAIGDIIHFPFLSKNCINNMNGSVLVGEGESFISDNDTFLLNERLLKLGMIWQWKAQKGTPYAEDMGTYEDALDREAGSDSPAPIIIGHAPISAATNVAWPWPPDWGSVTR